MKKLVVLLAACLLSFSSFGQSQAQLNVSTDASYRKADQELNRTYQQILREYRTNTNFLQSLKAAQKSWIQFRDAEAKARYPATNAQQTYGSAYPTCYAQVLTDLTKARTQQLQLWLTGIPEGDVCNGSVKVAGAK